MRPGSLHRLSTPILLLALIFCRCPALAAPELTADGSSAPVRSEEGKVLLEWADGEGTFRLEHARDAEFTDPLARYTGPDRASLVTGLEEGAHHFRVARLSDEGPVAMVWSNPVRVSVEYVDARLVVFLMIVGSLLFFATVGAVLIGHRRHAGDPSRTAMARGKESA